MGYLRHGIGGPLDFLTSTSMVTRRPAMATQVRPGPQPIMRTPTTPTVRPGRSAPSIAQIVTQPFQAARKFVMAPTMQMPGTGAGSPVFTPVTGGLLPAATPALLPAAPKPLVTYSSPGTPYAGGGGVMKTGGGGGAAALPELNFEIPDDAPTSSEFQPAAKKPFPTKVVVIAAVAAVGIYFVMRKKGK